MQIAQVVPKVRTKDEGIFDYSIPPQILPQIRVGVLVEVPFHNRKVEGIVIKLKPHSKVMKLKEIIRVIDPNPVIDDNHIKLSRWISDYYLSSLGKTIFENIVPPAKRTISKEKQNGFDISQRPKIIPNNFLLVGDFSFRLQYYLKEIKQAIKNKSSVIIIVPELDQIPIFTKHIKYQTVVLSSQMTKTSRWQAWNQIRKSNFQIVIGSQSAIFAPTNNLGLIIVDQEENDTYKNDRNPRFHILNVGLELSKIAGASLLAGSITPRVETYYRFLKNKFSIISQKSVTRKTIIVDMNNERGVISQSLMTKMNYCLQNSRKILLVLNRKGEGTKFSCKDCGWIANCPQCGLPLVPEQNLNYCFRCEKKFPQNSYCPNCNSLSLMAKGLGTAKLKQVLQNLFKDAKISIIEKDKVFEDNWQIAIVTSYALKYQFPEIELAAIIDADQTLNLPDFTIREKTFSHYYKFLRLGKIRVIQTHLPGDTLIKSLALMSFTQFLKDEFILRKNSQFPPAVKMIKLVYQNTDQTKALNEAKKVKSEIEKILMSNFSSTVYQPFIKKNLNKYRYQIILKFINYLHPKFEKSLKNYLSNLPSGWIVDVDPISTL